MGTTNSMPQEDVFDNARRTNIDEMSISFEDLAINTGNIQTSGEPVVPEPSTTHVLPTRDTEINTGAINPPENVYYEVEAVRDREDRDDGPYYLIKWRGYPEEQNTWEPLSNCQGCMSLINEFDDARDQFLLEELNNRFDDLCRAIDSGNVQISVEPVVPEPSEPPTRDMSAINPPGGKLYVVEAVRDREDRDDGPYYLIKWEGFPEEQNTWEPLSHFQGCMSLINEFDDARGTDID